MLAPVLALALFAPADPSAGQLYIQCLAELRLLDSPPAKQEQSDFVPGVGCIAYIDGFTDGVNLLGQRICIGNASLGTLARVYVAYMKANPKYMETKKNLALTLALEDSYPCPVKK